jgi:ABC-type antimicrobial peptide transport system permease subunit
VKLVEGRMFRPGNGRGHRRARNRQPFQGAGLGETLRFASADWTVVGIFDAGRTGLRLRDLGRLEQMMQAFRRLAFSALIFRLADTERFEAVKQAIESDPRLTLEAKRETRFYADQSELLSKFISYLGTTISIIFSIGAVIGAMITMYASVASRTAEIGTLRALGLLAHRDPRRVPRRGAAARARSAASSASSRPRSCRRSRSRRRTSRRSRSSRSASR